MSVQSSTINSSESPVQVWARLTVDLKQRVIHLMAQLAFNLVTAQSDWSTKESDYAQHTQDSA